MSQEELSRKVELSWLMAFYGPLLTDKQRQVLTLHCEEDFSLGEIAREAGISRQGVHDQLSRGAHRLFELEAQLGMAARFARTQEGMERCLACLRAGETKEAEALLERLIRLDQEENDGL